MDNLKQEKLLSALIVAHNEEDNLEACLTSVKFADEIVVVLDKCTDRSKEIAAKFTDKIIEGAWEIEGARRNVGLDNCSGKWILEIDADERISNELAAEILAAIKNPETSPARFIIPIANYIGKTYVKNGWLRAFGVTRRESVHYRGYKKYDEDKKIHPTAKVQGEAFYLKNPIKHLVDKDIADMIARFNRYTNWKADDMIKSGKIKGSFATNFFSFINRFFKSLILKKGYKEGSMGFLIALFAALYPLVSYLKAQEKLRNKNN
jgi:glycosyltransferase involved in cell wall biosynthesis